jgi:hypothetical protein
MFARVTAVEKTADESLRATVIIVPNQGDPDTAAIATEFFDFVAGTTNAEANAQIRRRCAARIDAITERQRLEQVVKVGAQIDV